MLLVFWGMERSGTGWNTDILGNKLQWKYIGSSREDVVEVKGIYSVK